MQFCPELEHLAHLAKAFLIVYLHLVTVAQHNMSLVRSVLSWMCTGYCKKCKQDLNDGHMEETGISCSIKYDDVKLFASFTTLKLCLPLAGMDTLVGGLLPNIDFGLLLVIISIAPPKLSKLVLLVF